MKAFLVSFAAFLLISTIQSAAIPDSIPTEEPSEEDTYVAPKVKRQCPFGNGIFNGFGGFGLAGNTANPTDINNAINAFINAINGQNINGQNTGVGVIDTRNGNGK